MNPFDYIKTLSHHAYFVHSIKDGAQKLKEHLKNIFGIESNQNPDFHHHKYEILGIDESRKIKENHLSKSFVNGSKKIFVIEVDSITHEAQNALLKIFEEPHIDVHFFLIMPNSEILLPTLRSRLMIIRPTSDDDFTTDIFSKKEVEEFLNMSTKERVDFVDDIAKGISDEKISKIHAIEFLEKLESNLYKKGLSKNSNALKAIIKAREYIGDRSSSVKQLLEYVALNIQ